VDEDDGKTGEQNSDGTLTHSLVDPPIGRTKEAQLTPGLTSTLCKIRFVVYTLFAFLGSKEIHTRRGITRVIRENEDGQENTKKGQGHFL
jgi:hypothetical protein